MLWDKGIVGCASLSLLLYSLFDLLFDDAVTSMRVRLQLLECSHIDHLLNKGLEISTNQLSTIAHLPQKRSIIIVPLVTTTPPYPSTKKPNQDSTPMTLEKKVWW